MMDFLRNVQPNYWADALLSIIPISVELGCAIQDFQKHPVAHMSADSH
jgi:hypothetical protein